MRTAILDGTYQMHRAVYSPGSDLVTSHGLPSGPTFIFLKMLWNFKEIGTPIVVFDSFGARSELRKSVYPEYKVRPPAKTEQEKFEKEETTKLLNYTHNTLKILLPRMGIPVVVVKDQEGDDVIYQLAKHFSAQGREVWAVSDDKDYLQFLNLPNTKVYQPMKDKQFTKEIFEAEYGFEMAKFVLYKAMMGDDSDNIAGVYGIGEKTAAKIVKELPDASVKSLYDWAESGNKSMHKKIKEGLPIIKRNLLLVDLEKMALTNDMVLAAYEQALQVTKIDIQFVMEQFRKYEFSSLGNWTTHLMHMRTLPQKPIGV